MYGATACHNRTDLIDDLDPEGERQLCAIAEKVRRGSVHYRIPLSGRPFYTHPRTSATAAGRFAFQRLKSQPVVSDCIVARISKSALTSRGMSHRPSKVICECLNRHAASRRSGNQAGASAQILGLQNVREATLYLNDRYRLTP
jgi:nondiscriminating aspartyl-tRNA synthetase